MKKLFIKIKCFIEESISLKKSIEIKVKIL